MKTERQERPANIALQREDTESQVGFSNGSVRDRRSLYGKTVNVLFNKGPKIALGVISGIWFEIREDDLLTSQGVRA